MKELEQKYIDILEQNDWGHFFLYRRWESGA